MIAGEKLTILRYVSLLIPVNIFEPNIQRISADRFRNSLNDVFHTSHALRPTEPAKRSVGRKVGPADLSVDFDVVNVISVLGVQQRSLHHRRRQISRGATIGIEIDFHSRDLASGIETNAPATEIRMSPAGHMHVSVFVVDNPCSLTCFRSDQRNHQRRNDGLSFFTTKRAAHPFADAHDLMLGKPQNLSNHRLDLSGILSR